MRYCDNNTRHLGILLLPMTILLTTGDFAFSQTANREIPISYRVGPMWYVAGMAAYDHHTQIEGGAEGSSVLVHYTDDGRRHETRWILLTGRKLIARTSGGAPWKKTAQPGQYIRAYQNVAFDRSIHDPPANLNSLLLALYKNSKKDPNGPRAIRIIPFLDGYKHKDVDAILGNFDLTQMDLSSLGCDSPEPEDTVCGQYPPAGTEWPEGYPREIVVWYESGHKAAMQLQGHPFSSRCTSDDEMKEVSTNPFTHTVDTICLSDDYAEPSCLVNYDEDGPDTCYKWCSGAADPAQKVTAKFIRDGSQFDSILLSVRECSTPECNPGDGNTEVGCDEFDPAEVTFTSEAGKCYCIIVEYVEGGAGAVKTMISWEPK